jgi:hypothetical protein
MDDPSAARLQQPGGYAALSLPSPDPQVPVIAQDRDRIPAPGQSTGTHAVPALHDVRWFTRRLPPGYEPSDEARAHAREQGIALRPDETFVLPHRRGLGSESLYYGSREMRSTHAVAKFEQAFWD